MIAKPQTVAKCCISYLHLEFNRQMLKKKKTLKVAKVVTLYYTPVGPEEHITSMKASSDASLDFSL